jgi:hypothetical protein
VSAPKANSTLQKGKSKSLGGGNGGKKGGMMGLGMKREKAEKGEKDSGTMAMRRK